MTRSVTKAMAIHFIDGKCHVQKWRCCKTALSGYYAWLSFDLLLMPSRADTLIHQRSWTKQFQETSYAWSAGPSARTWFKKRLALYKPLLSL